MNKSAKVADLSSSLEMPVHVLIVDDNSDHREMLKEMLSPIDATVLLAGGGEEALSILKDIETALVVLDVRMPEMDGFETLKKIRTEAHGLPVPIMMVTAEKVNERDAKLGYELGAVDFIEKPLNPYVFCAKAQTFCDLIRFYRVEEFARLQEELSAFGDDARHFAVKHNLFKGNLLRSELTDAEKDAMALRFRELLHLGLSDAGGNNDELRTKCTTFADWLGERGLGARILLTLHVRMLNELSSNLTSTHTRQLRDTSRLVVLEIMGHLVEHYRRQVVRFDEGVA